MQMLGCKYALLLSIFVVASLCDDRPPIITRVTETVVRNVSEDATLTCYVNNPEGYIVSWVKTNRDNPTDQTVLTFGTQLALKDVRFNVTATSDSFSLHIKNIDFSDAAVYQCQVTVSSNYKDVKTVDLLIRHPPKIDKDIQIEPSPATLNQSAELKCVADGYPQPSISWTRGDGKLLPAGGYSSKGSVLKITDVSKEDRGVYYCIADNGIGQPARRIVNFEVEFSPVVKAPRPKVAQALDYDIELACRVEGYPAPQISWFKNGNEIYNGGDYSITNTATTNDITKSVLRVITLDSSQYGDYVCKATNKLGSAEETLNLYAHTIPNINFSGLQWNTSSAPSSNHMQFFMNYIAMMIFAFIL